MGFGGFRVLLIKGLVQVVPMHLCSRRAGSALTLRGRVPEVLSRETLSKSPNGRFRVEGSGFRV